MLFRSDEVPPGEGILDLDAYVAVVRSLGPDVAVIVEHLPAEQVRRALAVTREAAAARGIVFAAPTPEAA